MYLNYVGKNKIEDYSLGNIVIFPESTVLRIGIVTKLIDSGIKRVIVIYGEYLKGDGKPSGEIMWIARNPDDCIIATSDEYKQEQVEYLIDLYNKKNKTNIKLIL